MEQPAAAPVPEPQPAAAVRAQVVEGFGGHQRTLALLFTATAAAMLVTPFLDLIPRLLACAVAAGAFAFVVQRMTASLTSLLDETYTPQLETLAARVQELEEQNATLAVVDRTTNVATSDYLFMRLREEIDRSRRYGRAVTLVIVDVVDFRTVNQRYGREMANIVLQRLALNLRSAVRTTDIVGRYGGGQFALMLPETDAEQAQAVIPRLVERAEQRIMLAADLHVLLKVRTATATYPAAGATPELLVRAAEQELAAAKAAAP